MLLGCPLAPAHPAPGPHNCDLWLACGERPLPTVQLSAAPTPDGLPAAPGSSSAREDEARGPPPARTDPSLPPSLLSPSQTGPVILSWACSRCWDCELRWEVRVCDTEQKPSASPPFISTPDTDRQTDGQTHTDKDTDRSSYKDAYRMHLTGTCGCAPTRAHTHTCTHAQCVFVGIRICVGAGKGARPPVAKPSLPTPAVSLPLFSRVYTR